MSWLYQPLPLAGGSEPAPDVSMDGWYRELSTPTRRPAAIALLVAASVISPWALTQAEAVTESRWHQPWSEPVRVKKLPTAQQQAAAWVPIVAETVTSDKWFAPFRDPVRFRVLPAAQQQSAAWVPLVVEVVTSDKWFSGFSDPTRAKPKQYAQFPAVFARPEPSTGWFSPLSEPVLVKARQYQPIAYVAPDTAEAVTADKWFAQLSEPKRWKPRVAWQQDLVAVPFMEATNYAKWGYAFSEPVRLKKGLRADLQSTTVKPADVPAEIVTVDKWLSAFSIPKRDRPRTAQYEAVARPSFIVPLSYGWYQPLSLPKRTRPWLYSVSPEGFYFRGENNPVPSMASWNYGFSSPVRLRTGLLAAQQEASVMPIDPIPTPPGPTGQYTVSGLYVIDQFTDNTVVYDYNGGVSHRTN